MCKNIQNFFGAQWRFFFGYSKVTDLIQLEFELVRDFMPVLVTSKFDEGPIKNEHASLETPFSHYKSMGNVLDAKRHLTP